MGRLHCRYTLSGADAADVGARLDRVAAQAVTRTGSALQELLGDTPAVYVLRDVTTRHRWSVTQLSDDELGELWGRGIATALVRAIAGDPGGGSNLIRFSDHADYVASFVADLVDGSAWSHWWYGAFTPYAARPRRQALLDVLLEHRAGLAGILAVLYRRGALGRVVDALGEPARRVLWGAPVVPPPQDREAVRPLLAAAIELARALGLWAGRLDQAAALDRYVATGPRERAWSDPRDLADGVWEAFRWLDAAGALEATAPGQPARVAGPEWRGRPGVAPTVGRPGWWMRRWPRWTGSTRRCCGNGSSITSHAARTPSPRLAGRRSARCWRRRSSWRGRWGCGRAAWIRRLRWIVMSPPARAKGPGAIPGTWRTGSGRRSGGWTRPTRSRQPHPDRPGPR